MIKWLACLFMLIDHIGLLFFPEQIMFRLIGRLSMPLYAYCIARGIRHTHDIKQYFFRVLTIAFVSQFPFQLMVREFRLNICFLWAGAIAMIWACKCVECLLKRFFIAIGIILVCMVLPLDYGLYGLSYVVVLYCFGFQNNDIKMYGMWTVIHAFRLIRNLSGGIAQLFTLPTIAIIDICNRYGLEKQKKSSNFVTWFYPGHMIILLVLYVLIY